MARWIRWWLVLLVAASCGNRAAVPAAPSPTEAEPARIHHQVAVRLEPTQHQIEITDRISTADFRRGFDPAPGGGVSFRLHAGLAVEADAGSGFVVEAASAAPAAHGFGGGEAGPAVSLREYVLKPAGGAWPKAAEPVLRIRGQIHHALESEEQEYARSFARSPGIISEEGVVLSGASYWLPSFGDQMLSFRLDIDLPAAWDAVSQGRRVAHHLEKGRRLVSWVSAEPMDEAYLIAAPFTEYAQRTGDVDIYAFLRTPDPALAATYLDTTARYLEMYGALLGPYPYAKFALVENFWETGYGMPSFTLLGPKIIRFPFILHSSYPHEILHNWWGNSVFVDWEKGNWCEGLTAYLADHLIKEGQGGGTAYRRDTLKKYRSYVRDEKDFPLTEFRSRHSSASEAVGYGKSLMLYHMLRIRLGDERFVEGLRRFYRDFRFRKATFADLEATFSEVGGTDLRGFFQQWLVRTGAPALMVRAERKPGNRVALEIRQTQEDEPYALAIPVAVTMRGVEAAHVVVLELTERQKRYEIAVAAEPVRVDVDPFFDVFRRLDLAETPPVLGEIFGADRVTVVVPDGGDTALDGAWRTLAESWRQGGEGNVVVARASDLAALPDDRAVWILGSDNRWATAIAASLTGLGAGRGENQIGFGEERMPMAGTSFAFVTRHPGNPDLAVGWIGSDTAAAVPGLGRKLPHYGKYSFLGFSGDEPTNAVKGQWPVDHSPLVALLSPEAKRGALPDEAPLTRLEPLFDPDKMMAHVRYLAADERTGRGVGTPGLDESAVYIARAFEKAGLEPGGDRGGYFQYFTEQDGPDGKPVTLRNVVGVLRGTKTDLEGESVVVGAHYDHLGLGWPDVRTGNQGKVHNGADDNASGVAVLLALAARLVKEGSGSRTVVFVAFSAEEWGLKGSAHYVRSSQRYPAKQAIAMINLDTVGRLDGKKLSVLGCGSAREWKHIAMGIGYTTGVDNVCVDQDPAGSDQKSFREVGVPAVQLFAGAHSDYHAPGDDAGAIDPAGLVATATFAREAIAYLAGRDGPLSSGAAGPTPGGPPAGGGSARRASLGTMPDFGFSGPGVRVASVTEGSPAAKAGIRAGDVLLALDGKPIADLRGYSDLLKQHAPGDAVEIEIQRGANKQTVKATLGAR